MAGCYNHCYINVLAAHTGIKLNLYNSILTSIGSLCAIDRYLGLIQTPRWAPMKNDRVQKIKETAEISKNRCDLTDYNQPKYFVFFEKKESTKHF